MTGTIHWEIREILPCFLLPQSLMAQSASTAQFVSPRAMFCQKMQKPVKEVPKKISSDCHAVEEDANRCGWKSGLTGIGNLLSCKRLSVLWHTAQHAGRQSAVSNVWAAAWKSRDQTQTHGRQRRSSSAVCLWGLVAHCHHLQIWHGFVGKHPGLRTKPH